MEEEGRKATREEEGRREVRREATQGRGGRERVVRKRAESGGGGERVLTMARDCREESESRVESRVESSVERLGVCGEACAACHEAVRAAPLDHSWWSSP